MAVADSEPLTLDVEETHRPLRIRAMLRTGVAYDPPYGLDLAGILASRLRSIARAELDTTGSLTTTPLPDSTEYDPADMLLPLSRCTTGPDWHWLASCAIPTDPDEAPEPRTFYRNVDTSWLHRAATRPIEGNFHPSKGPYRVMMMPSPVVVTHELTWLAVGDPKRVEQLLTPLRFIGRRRAVGEGRVLSWSVDVVDDVQPGPWAHCEMGTLVRPCPEECAQALHVEYDLTWYAIRPPSWSPDRLQRLACSPDREGW